MKEVSEHHYQLREEIVILDRQGAVGSITLACAAGFVAMASIVGIILAV